MFLVGPKVDRKTRAVAPFSPDARTFHNIYIRFIKASITSDSFYG
jgi:hypothetical protein